MLDLRGRSRLAPILDPIASLLGKMRLTPTIVTVLGLLVTIVGGVLIASGRYVAGASVSGVGSLLDTLDGALARMQGTASDKGAFIDTMSDRFGEVAVLVGLAFSLRSDETGLMLCVFALTTSLLIPYVRSKAESWGAEGRGGWMGRAERVILVLLGVGLSGLGLPVLHPMLWIFITLTTFTVAQRIRNTWRQLG